MDDCTEMLDKAYKAGEQSGLRQVGRARDNALGAGFCIGIITGIVGMGVAAEFIAWWVR